MFELWLILGIILILVGFLMAMPFLGIGMFIPVLGDVIDIPISAILIAAGSILLFIGGLGYIITQFWWIIVIGFALWYFLFVIKIGTGIKRKKMVG